MKNDKFTYFCKKFLKEIAGKSYEENVKDKLKYNLDTDSLPRIGGCSIMRVSNGIRIIIEKISFEGYTIHFVRDIIEADSWSKVYSLQFRNNQWLENNLLPENEIAIAKEEYYENKNRIKNKKKEQPPKYLVEWHNDFHIKLNFEIYETPLWVNFAVNDSETEGMRERDIVLFRKLLSDLVKNNISNYKTESINGINIIKSDEIAILYSKLEELNKSYYLLHGGANFIIQEQHYDNLMEKIKDENPKSLEDIRRLALRAYPSFTLIPNQKELWNKIQRSSENSNFSLLQEQINFLETVELPAYINGQAGSGKSTMLYYLFSHAYMLNRISIIKGNILFLTENEILLDATKIAIKDILVNNSEFNLDFIKDFENFDNFFKSFKSFLLDQIPTASKNKFPQDKYLNFSRFKSLYEDSTLNKNIINKYSAEEAWFAITTYTYGYKNNEEITSQNYNEINRDSRILSKERFKNIEEKVLPFYNKLIYELNYWDKLKIIRFIKENDIVTEKYAFILCDEAQDFCRVELRFILQLLDIIDYDLSEQTQVPIVFAGDPNQTVNPTGFRLNEMKNILYKELKETAGFKIELQKNEYSPIYNYRSSQSVVKLANYIQYFRLKNFSITAEPQKSKQIDFSEGYNQNSFIEEKIVLKDEKLIEKLRYKVFVLPINSAEKEEYIKSSQLLSTISSIDAKTSIEAKGTEYDQVVLYGFGNYFLDKFGSLNAEEDDEFRKRYFFNKLYVGVTRAKKELIIIDTEQAKSNFWKEIIKKGSNINYAWQELNEYEEVIMYDANTINVLDSTPETALENAFLDKKRGIEEENPNKLKMVAKQFFRLGKSSEQYLCLAIAEKINNEWEQAGKYYIEARTNESILEANACFWKGGSFKELLLNNQSTEVKNNPQLTVQLALSKIIITEPNRIDETAIHQIYDYKNFLKEVIKNTNLKTSISEKIILLSKIAEDKIIKREFAEILSEIALEIEESESIYSVVGELFYDIALYQRAVDAWDQTDNIDSKEYINAKIQLAINNFNPVDEIIWLDKYLKFQSNEENKIKTQHKIVNLYKNLSNEQVETEDKIYLLAIYKVLINLYDSNKDLEDDILKLNHLAQETFSNKTMSFFFYEMIEKTEQESDTIFNFLLERWAKNYFISKNNNVESIDKINVEYKKIALDKDKLYKAFSKDEIDTILLFPPEIHRQQPKHFKEVTIKNFRRFENLELKNLGIFNLIVGDNNTGKTSLLEALLFDPNETEFADRLFFAHIDRCNVRNIEDIKNNDKFLENFSNAKSNSQKVKFSFKENRQIWNYSFPNEIHNFRNKDLKNSVYKPFVAYGKGFDEEVANTYNEGIHVLGKKVRNEFIENMRVFIPNIDALLYIDNDIRVEEKENDEEGMSITQYGEGANKLFRILVQMFLQKNNKILIDEIDAGIHHSRFIPFWIVILKLAKANNTQIFTTTHNLECIEYFVKVLEKEDMKEYRDLSRTITLYENKEGKIKSLTRTFDAFDMAINNEYNIRGGE